jgi:hypothetical protein
MGAVNDPQVWTLIGVFTTIMLGGMTLMTAVINRATAHAIGGLDAKFDAKFDGLRGEMNARFDTVNTKIEHLDRDVNMLIRRAWGEASGE